MLDTDRRNARETFTVEWTLNVLLNLINPARVPGQGTTSRNTPTRGMHGELENSGTHVRCVRTTSDRLQNNSVSAITNRVVNVNKFLRARPRAPKRPYHVTPRLECLTASSVDSD